MRKIITIARRYIYTTFKDFNLFLIMLVTPLVLSTIIALAFSDVFSGGAPLRNIPVAVVNLDKGVDVGDMSVNNGNILMNVFIPPTSSEDAPPIAEDDTCAPLMFTDTTTTQQASMSGLVSATRLATPDLARTGVDNGSYAAAVIIPENFSQSITYTGPGFTFNPIQIEVYGDPNRSISAGVVRSIVESVTNSILAGNITFATFYNTLITQNWTQALMLSASGTFNESLACAFNPSIVNLQIDTQSIRGEKSTPFNPLVSFGASISGFFALFTASGGATNILEERRNGTLQRMFMSPTARTTIMLGLVIGIFFIVLLQLVFLFVALTLINSILNGGFAFIWGTNVFAVAILLLVTSLSVSGVGILVASLAKTAEQSNIVGSVIAMFMGVLGGAFFSIETLGEPIGTISRLSVIRWSTEGFTRLSQGNTDIWLNVLWLLILGIILFGTGTLLFNRRQDL
ncbi:MAG: hypothetical protein CUN52_08535 [Phototrophicales bacterium]|nr:MAG: hypothetical protein CUN52_08535 [Phototrophicales bacterium]